jgi:hypothetical protein
MSHKYFNVRLLKRTFCRGRLLLFSILAGTGITSCFKFRQPNTFPVFSEPPFLLPGPAPLQSSREGLLGVLRPAAIVRGLDKKTATWHPSELSKLRNTCMRPGNSLRAE